MESTEMTLCHYGVKGMKWGVRKAPTKKTQKWDAQKARKEYAELDRRRAAYDKADVDYKTAHKNAYKRSAGALSPFKEHRLNTEKRWADATKKGEELADAKKAYKEQKKSVSKNTTLAQKMERGATQIPKVPSKVGTMYITDQYFNGGAGTKVVTSAIKAVGMATITAYTMARGGYDIKWYDKAGNRVG